MQIRWERDGSTGFACLRNRKRRDETIAAPGNGHQVAGATLAIAKGFLTRAT